MHRFRAYPFGLASFEHRRAWFHGKGSGVLRADQGKERLEPSGSPDGAGRPDQVEGIIERDLDEPDPLEVDQGPALRTPEDVSGPEVSELEPPRKDGFREGRSQASEHALLQAAALQGFKRRVQLHRKIDRSIAPKKLGEALFRNLGHPAGDFENLDGLPRPSAHFARTPHRLEVRSVDVTCPVDSNPLGVGGPGPGDHPPETWIPAQYLHQSALPFEPRIERRSALDSVARSSIPVQEHEVKTMPCKGFGSIRGIGERACGPKHQDAAPELLVAGIRDADLPEQPLEVSVHRSASTRAAECS